MGESVKSRNTVSLNSRWVTRDYKRENGRRGITGRSGVITGHINIREIFPRNYRFKRDIRA